jgi:hypothetical protein
MIKRETFSLLSMISVYYEQFTFDQKKVDLWHEVLKVYSFEELKQNLLSFVSDSIFPPKVSDLVQKSPLATTIPNPEETKIMIYTTHRPARKEVVQREMAKMREILGIVSGEADGRY